MTRLSLRRFRTAAGTLAVLVGGALAAETSTPAQQQMSISGRIVSAATGRPIPGASAHMRVSDAVLGAAADGNGAFRMTTTAPGRYYVGASAPGYRSRAFGEVPEIGHTPVVLKEGQNVRGIEIALHRGATVAGVVTDDLKEPVVSGTVRAFARRLSYGEMRLVSVAETKTDDRGEYRLPGLAPGDYVVGVVDGPLISFAPSAASSSAATTVTIKEDVERTGVNIQTRVVKTGAVEGAVTGPGAGSPRLAVQLVPDPNFTTLPPLATQQSGGRFGFKDVPAGRYHLIVRPGLNSELPRAWGTTPIVVTAGGTTQANLIVNDAPRISGTIESVGIRGLTISLRPITADDTSASVNSLRAAAQGSFEISAVPPGRYQLLAGISEQGDVLLSHKRPRVTDPGVHRLISSIFVKGEDVSDRVFVIAPNTSVEGIRVTVTETGARITGTVLDAVDKPTTVGAVVVFPSDPREWTVVSRRIRVTRADTDGVFHVPLLPPGRYRVAHVRSLAPGQLSDAAFLKTLTGAEEVTLGDGAVSTLQLRLK